MGTTIRIFLEREPWRNVRAAMARQRHAVLVPDVTRAAVKGAICRSLLAVPSLRAQCLLAAIVRRVWPGFRRA